MRRQKVSAAEIDPLSLFMAQATVNNDEDVENENKEKVPVVVTPPVATSSTTTTHQKSKGNPLMNTLAPDKPIDYEPPHREPIKTPVVQQEPINKKPSPVVTPAPAPAVAPPAPVVVVVREEPIKVEKQKEVAPLPTPPPSSVASVTPPVAISQQPVTQKQPEKQIVKPPPAPASVFETGDDVFLKKASGDDDIFGTADGELSELKFISTKVKPASSSKMDENLSEEEDEEEEDNQEEKLDDLAVGSMLEREELDFDMFGRSNVKQYQAQPVSKSKPTLYQDDFTLESEDDLNQMESILNQTQSTKKSSSTSSTTKSGSSSSTIDITSFDINAYISQQENDNNVSLFG